MFQHKVREGLASGYLTSVMDKEYFQSSLNKTPIVNFLIVGESWEWVVERIISHQKYGKML